MDLERSKSQKKKDKDKEKIRKCQFRETLTQKVKKKLYMHSKKLKLLDGENWNFYGTTYVKEGWDKVMPYVSVGICEGLNISRNVCPHALSTISSTNFPYLKDLSLASCKIVNIEAVAFLDMNHLERINLSENMITIFKPLNKMKFPKLQFLLVSVNPSSQYGYQRIMLAKISKMVYEEQPFISLFDYQDDIEPVDISESRYRQDYAALAKLQTEETFIHRYQNRMRIHQPKVNDAIGKKYSNFLALHQGMIFYNGGF